MFSRIRLCVRAEILFFQANGIAGFGSLNLFSLVILSVFFGLACVGRNFGGDIFWADWGLFEV